MSSSINRLLLGLLLVVGTAQLVQAQSSPNCAAIPPAASLNDGTATWTLVAQQVQRNGIVWAGGLVSTVNCIDGAIYVVSTGTAYKYLGPTANDYQPVGTLPPCAGTPPPPHACDVVAPSTQTITAGTHTVSSCAITMDSNGNPMTIIGWSLTYGTTTVPITMMKGSTPNSAGAFEYTSQSIAFPSGTYPLLMTMQTSLGPSTSEPITVIASAPVGPSKPGRGRVK